jgi:hypothetical protein
MLNLSIDSQHNRRQEESLVNKPNLSKSHQKFLDFIKPKYVELGRFILMSFTLIALNVIGVLIFKNFFFTWFNLLTLSIYALVLYLCYHFTQGEVNKINSIVEEAQVTNYNFSRIFLKIYISMILVIFVTANFFYTIWAKLICDFFNIINVMSDDPMRNLTICIIGFLFYGCANITIPVVIAWESRRIVKSFRIFENSKINKPNVELRTTSSETSLGVTNHGNYSQV